MTTYNNKRKLEDPIAKYNNYDTSVHKSVSKYFFVLFTWIL